jgi:hypothetical protein
MAESRQDSLPTDTLSQMRRLGKFQLLELRGNP